MSARRPARSLAHYLPLLLLLAPLSVLAQALPAFTSTPSGGGGTTYSLSIQTLLMLTALSFLPSMLLMMTSFTRVVIVLSLLRHAMGMQTSPPNMIVIGLSLFLTFFIMAPVGEQIYVDAYKPLTENKISFEQAVEIGIVPVRRFMLRQSRDSDITFFARISKTPKVDSPDELPLRVIIPAFMTSELKTAFQIGFIIFIPFLVIDMVVASVLMSMGMMMMSPVTVAMPFKLMLFVLVDGWTLVLGSLVQSFG